jgi:hypothetical protein
LVALVLGQSARTAIAARTSSKQMAGEANAVALSEVRGHKKVFFIILLSAA